MKDFVAMVFLAVIVVCVAVLLAHYTKNTLSCEQRTPIEVPVCSYKEPK